jgi:hypothetical protein
MKLIDRIALNRLLSVIASLIITLAKIFANKSDNQPDTKPGKPKPLKRIINIIPLPWRNK